MSSDAETPLSDELVHALQHSRAQAFCHDIVMDAIDISMAFDRHLLVYGIEGLFLLETEDASWRQPPSRVAWIPAGTHVKATTIKQVRCTSVFLQRDFAPPLADDLLVFSASPVIREMIKHSRRWTVETGSGDDELERFFLTLLDLCRAQVHEGSEFALPKARSPELNVALQHTLSNLAEPIRLEDAAGKAAMSPRTLMRRLSSEIDMTWGQYLHRARMLRSMECLARGTSVTQTSLEVGYTNMAAFSTAFRKFTDMTPSDYRAQF